MIWVWIFVSLVVAALIYSSLWVFLIWYRVKHSPRAEIFVCPKHGAMLKDHLINFCGEVYCVRCFSEKREWAKKNPL